MVKEEAQREQEGEEEKRTGVLPDLKADKTHETRRASENEGDVRVSAERGHDGRRGVTRWNMGVESIRYARLSKEQGRSLTGPEQRGEPVFGSRREITCDDEREVEKPGRSFFKHRVNVLRKRISRPQVATSTQVTSAKATHRHLADTLDARVELAKVLHCLLGDGESNRRRSEEEVGPDALGGHRAWGEDGEVTNA